MLAFQFIFEAIKNASAVFLFSAVLSFLVGCQTPSASLMSHETESLYIESQFKPLYALYPVIAPMPFSVVEEMKNGNDPEAAHATLTPFDYNLMQLIGEVSGEYISIDRTSTEATSHPFIACLYTDLDTYPITLTNAQSSIIGRPTLFKFKQSFHFILYTGEDDTVGGLYGHVSFYFNSFDSNAAKDMVKLKKIYQHVFPYFGKTLNSVQEIKFTRGILREEAN